MKLIASLESGIRHPQLSELFQQHPEFVVEISENDNKASKHPSRFVFFDENGIFFQDTGKVECLQRTSVNGAYGLIKTSDGYRIHLWAKNTLPPRVDREAPTGETFEQISAEKPEDKTSKRVQDILKGFHEGLDNAGCGEDITVSHFTILEATYYSDDVENGLKPYWQAIIQDDYTNVTEVVRDWRDMEKFIRAML